MVLLMSNKNSPGDAPPGAYVRSDRDHGAAARNVRSERAVRFALLVREALPAAAADKPIESRAVP